MKKIFCLLLASAMVLSLAGCAAESERDPNLEATNKLREETDALISEIEENRANRKERLEKKIEAIESGTYDFDPKQKENVPDAANAIYAHLQEVYNNDCDVEYSNGIIYALYWTDYGSEAAYNAMDTWDRIVQFGELEYKSLTLDLDIDGYDAQPIVLRMLSEEDLTTVLLEVSEDGVVYDYVANHSEFK